MYPRGGMSSYHMKKSEEPQFARSTLMIRRTFSAATPLGGGRRTLRSPSEACGINPVPAFECGAATGASRTRSGTKLRSRMGPPCHGANFSRNLHRLGAGPSTKQFVFNRVGKFFD